MLGALPDGSIEVKALWPNGLKPDEQIEIARRMAQFFAVLDNASRFKGVLKHAIIEFGILSKEKNVSEAAMEWINQYEQNQVQPRQKNNVIVPANRSLEP